MNYKKKILNLLNIFFKEDIKIHIYKKKIIKIKKISKKNLNIITFDKIFFNFKFDLNDSNVIIYILKSINIKIYKIFPFKEIIDFYNYKNSVYLKNHNYIFDKFLNKDLKFNKNVNNLIYKKFKGINFYLKIISKITLSNIFFLNSIFRVNKKKTLKGLIYKIKSLKSNICFDKYFFLKYKNFNKKFFFKKKKIKKNILKNIKTLYSKSYFNLIRNFSTLNFIVDNIIYYRLKKKKIYKFLLKFLKNKIFKFKINLNMIDCFFHIIIKKFNYFNNLRNEIYNFISNISNLSYLKFNFFFLKYGSNLKWILNIINFDKKNIFLKNKIHNFILKKSLKIKKIQKKYFTKIKNIFKIFNIIEINKIKIDIIRNNIINSKIKLIDKLCKKKCNNNDLKNNLIQEGRLSLINSINCYDLKSKFDFEKFVIYNAKKKINNYIYNDNKLIKLPKNIISLSKKINKIIKKYNNNNNINPDVNFISKALNLKKIKIEKTLNFCKNFLSLNNLPESEKVNFDEFLKNEKNFDFDEEIFNNNLRDYVEKITINLNDNRGSNILNMRYGFDFSRRHSLSEVGKIYDLSRERIRQIQKGLLKKIKDTENIEKLNYFFDSSNKYYFIKNKE